MTIFNTSEVIGVHQVNSVDFVRTAFQIYNSGDLFAVLKSSHSGREWKREITPASGGGWLDLKQDIIRDDSPAQIVFTSGTEGEPKAILLSHLALADVVSRLNTVMKLDESVREYVGIPVTYSFGFGRCRAVAAVGGRCYIPNKGFNPVELASMLAADEINAVSAVPTLWRALLAQPEVIGALGKKVMWIEIGSQYMSREEKEQMKALFPNAIIVQHYGLTEASRTTILDISATEGARLESVGQAFGDVDVKISPEGRIMICGPHVATGEIIRDRIIPLVDADGWLTTGDFGRIENTVLYYEGRADDLINCSGVKVSPDLLQEKINRRLGVENQIAVSRLEDKLRGEGFFVAVETGSDILLNKVQDIVLDELRLLGVNAKSSVHVQSVSRIPRTDTGKVRRKELSQLYVSVDVEKKDLDESGQERSIPELFADMFPGENIKPADSFQSLGGDSLNYVQMLMLLEERLGFIPADWDKLTIEHLGRVERKEQSSLYSWLDTSIFLRVLAILGVVATHSGGTVLGGGTLLLFALIGYNMARFKSADFIDGKVWPWVRAYASVILIPYFLVAALYLGWNKSFEPDVLLLYANLVSAKITVIFPFWFVQVLVQCLILFGLIFSIPALRSFAARAPVRFSFSVLAFLIAIRVLYPIFWDTKYLNNLVPPRFMAILWLGWCCYFVKNLQQRLLLCAIGVAFAFLDTGLSTVTRWLILGSVFLTLVPRVPIPAFTKRFFNDVGAATFYIFIFNGIIISVLAHKNITSGPLVFCISLLGSMSIWWVMERLQLIGRAKAWVSSMSSPS